jgi:hypothetical protein
MGIMWTNTSTFTIDLASSRQSAIRLLSTSYDYNPLKIKRLNQSVACAGLPASLAWGVLKRVWRSGLFVWPYSARWRRSIAPTTWG